MNATLHKFGFPETIIKEYEHWVLLLRAQQVTLGSMVLAAKSEATSVGALPSAAFAELGQIIPELEHVLKKFCPYDRINYLTLMMVDPHVHTHIIPRYAQSQSFAKQNFTDAGWPGIADLKSYPVLSPDILANLRLVLHRHFNSEA